MTGAREGGQLELSSRPDVTVHRDLPRIDRVLNTLDAAYGGWGSRALFEWKYRYPGTDRDEHHVYVSADDRVAAFARLYHRELCIYGGNRVAPVIVRGNAAVHPEYQGNGLYRQLHRATERQSEEYGTSAVITFNRTDNRSFRTGSKSDWEYRSVPLYVNVLSPGPVLESYAESIVRSDDWLERLTDTIGPHVDVVVDGDRVGIEEVAGEPRSEDTRRFDIHLSGDGLDDLVESVGTGASVPGLARTGAKLLRDGAVGVRPGAVSGDTEADRSDPDWEFRDELTEQERRRLRELYDHRHAVCDVFFRRDERDVDHLLSHPSLLGTVLVRDEDGTIDGIAPLYETAADDVTEVRVMDLLYEGEPAFDRLTAAIGQQCRQSGADILAAFAERRPGDDWARISRHVMMWDDRTADGALGRQLATGRWHLGFYDVV